MTMTWSDQTTHLSLAAEHVTGRVMKQNLRHIYLKNNRLGPWPNPTILLYMYCQRQGPEVYNRSRTPGKTLALVTAWDLQHKASP